MRAKREQERQAAAAKQNQQINTTVTPAKGDSSVASGVVSLAYSLLGVPYVSGGSSPSGFDCSGFTSYLFRQYGISISRSSSAQAYVVQRLTDLPMHSLAMLYVIRDMLDYM